MNTSAHDFVTVDMRGLKAALAAHAKSKRTTVSAVVREAVEARLGSSDREIAMLQSDSGRPDDRAGWVKLSVRVRRAEARRVDAAAKAAGLSRGAYLVGLADGVPVLQEGGARQSLVAVLVSSCAELSTLSRNVHRLAALLREGNVQQALGHRLMLYTIAGDVDDHLKLAASGLAKLGIRSPVHPAASRHRSTRSGA